MRWWVRYHTFSLSILFFFSRFVANTPRTLTLYTVCWVLHKFEVIGSQNRNSNYNRKGKNNHTLDISPPGKFYHVWYFSNIILNINFSWIGFFLTYIYVTCASGLYRNLHRIEKSERYAKRIELKQNEILRYGLTRKSRGR